MRLNDSNAIVVWLVGALSAALFFAPVTVWSDDDDNDNADQDAAGPGVAGVGKDPDLKIEYLGYVNSSSTNAIEFKVTNVGTARSSQIKARIVTLEPVPTPRLGEPDVPRLNPGASVEITYELSADCNGHKVRATVTDPKDENRANDRAEVDVCPPKPAPPTLSGSDFDKSRILSPGVSIVPVHLQLGEHQIEFEPFATKWWGLRANISENQCKAREMVFLIYDVGFDHKGEVCRDVDVGQMIILFDLRWMDLVDSIEVYGAALRWEESDVYVREANGRLVTRETCIGHLGELSNSPQLIEAVQSDLTSKIPIRSDRAVVSPRIKDGYEVTGRAQSAASSVNNQFLGYVLHAADESFFAEDEAACLSSVKNPRLDLHYVVR